MRKPELDFLHDTPPQPLASWVLLAAGILLAALATGRYIDIEQSLAGEQAIAASLAAERPARKPARDALPAQADAVATERTQLELPWDTLLLRLEQSRPDDIALLSLEADGRKREANLTAETRKPGIMLDYIERLRRQPGLDAVVLSSHAVRVENPQQPLRFVVRLRWRK